MDINKCPVCGTAELRRGRSRFDGFRSWYVTCACGLRVRKDSTWDTRQHAVDAWNKEVPGNGKPRDQKH